MNAAHKLKLTNKYLGKLNIQLARLEREMDGYGDDVPARLCLVNARLKATIFKLKNKLYENSIN